jgi:two-component system LytT family response regulator
MKLRVVIADDERLARQRLRRFLNHDGQLEIVAECDGGTPALEAVRKHKPDLLLLDVEIPERVRSMLMRVRNHLSKQRAQRLVTAPKTSAAPSHFTIRSGQSIRVIPLHEIDWIEADGNYAVLYVGSQNHLMRETMAALEKRLPRQFARVSRSAIVQLTRVNQFRSWKGRHVALLRQGDEIPITRSIREVEAQLRSL